MSKAQRERSPSRDAVEKPPIPERFQHTAAIMLLFLSLVVFFHQIIFGGKTFLDVDTIASHSFDTFLADAREQGVFPLWNPYIFCGMPAYGSLTVTGERTFDLTAQVLSAASRLFSTIIFSPPIGWVLFYYFLFAVGVYLFTVHKVQSKLAAFIAAFSATFSMFIIIWVMAGHNTKIAVMAFFPYVFLLVEKQRDRFSLPLALLLVLALHFMFMPSHVQMIFYVFFAVGVYFLFLLIRSVLRKGKTGTTEAETGRSIEPMSDLRGLLRSGIVFVAASLLAFGMDADRYLSVLEYNPHSIRGSNPIVQSVGPGEAKTVEGGLDYEYATSWSFAPGEMITWLIPSWYGFGVHDYKGMLTGNQERKINTYWGPQPFTHAPQYMGLILLLLAVAGFVKNRRDPFVQYLGVMIALSVLIAFGKELPIVYDLMYRYFPMFNKFRIPSMILVLVQIFVPVLAAYGVVSLLRQREQLSFAELQKKKKSLLVGMGVAAVACIGLAQVYQSLLPRQAIQNLVSGVFGYGLPRDRVVEDFLRRIPPEVSNHLTTHVAGLVATDLYVALGLLVVTLGSLSLYLQKKMKLQTFAILLVAAIGFDLWRVAYKPMEVHERARQEEVFAAPEHVRFLQNDSTLFRVLEFQGGQPPYDNTLAYWRIQNAYGYQGAKMRAYQDVADVVGLRNPLVQTLMNVKYVITDQPDTSVHLGLVYNGEQKKVYSNLDALPRAFFVNRYEVADGLTTLNKIVARSFDPREVVYLMEDPGVPVEPVHPAAQAEFTRYGIQEFELKLTAGGTSILFLSETYYPEGWKAFLDGQEIPIYRANYLFRAVIVPAGNHRLEMRFEPRGFSIGKNLSLAANLFVLGGLCVSSIRWHKRRRKRRGGSKE